MSQQKEREPFNQGDGRQANCDSCQEPLFVDNTHLQGGGVRYCTKCHIEKIAEIIKNQCGLIASRLKDYSRYFAIKKKQGMNDFYPNAIKDEIEELINFLAEQKKQMKINAEEFYRV